MFPEPRTKSLQPLPKFPHGSLDSPTQRPHAMVKESNKNPKSAFKSAKSVKKTVHFALGAKMGARALQDALPRVAFKKGKKESKRVVRKQLCPECSSNMCLVDAKQGIFFDGQWICEGCFVMATEGPPPTYENWN